MLDHNYTALHKVAPKYLNTIAVINIDLFALTVLNISARTAITNQMYFLKKYSETIESPKQIERHDKIMLKMPEKHIWIVNNLFLQAFPMPNMHL